MKSTPIRPTSALSIERKLPLIIGGLLLLAVGALSWLSIRELRETSVQVASQRLRGATDQLSAALETSAGALRTQTAAIAARPGITAFAANRSPALRARALADLSPAGAQPETFVGAELRDETGAVVVSTVPAHFGTAALAVNDVLPRTEPGDSAVIGGFRAVGDTLIYPVAAPVPGAGDLYVVRWRRLGATRRSRENITNLIGSDAAIFIGNADGSRWSDFDRQVQGPTLDQAAGAAGIHSYERGDARRLASVTGVPRTPWLIAVEFPESVVMQPVEIFAGKQALVAIVVVVLGLLAAWLLSRGITRPLGELTVAARAITKGDFDHPVRVRSADEFGVLAAAFGTMAAEVKEGRRELEGRVDERTRDLNATLAQLRDAQDTLVRSERLAMLGQLSSGIGHELRNPLGVMTNAVYYLKTVLAQSPGTVHEYLDIVSQQIALSEKIVGDLLDFARKKQPQRKQVPVRSALDAQVERLGKRDGIAVELDVPDDVPDVLVDPVQFGQIVLNLLTNASQAMDGVSGVHGGRITVRARSAGTDAVEIDVSDTGTGVSAENAEKIFEPLFTTKARGIGLGLAVSRMLARNNGGDLTLVRGAAVGATFRLRLEREGERETGTGTGDGNGNERRVGQRAIEEAVT